MSVNVPELVGQANNEERFDSVQTNYKVNQKSPPPTERERAVDSHQS